MSAFPKVNAPELLLERPTPALVLSSLRGRRTEMPLGFATRPAEVCSAETLPAEICTAEVSPQTCCEEAWRELLLPGVVELAALPGTGAITLALLMLAEARKRALARAQPAWLCAIDPTRTLHASAVAALGIPLHELVVAAPQQPAQVLRTAVRAQRSGAFCGMLIDASDLADVSNLMVPLRRLALACEDNGATAVILTSTHARRGYPLPVAVRALVETLPHDELEVRFLRHRHGQRPHLRFKRMPADGGTGAAPASLHALPSRRAAAEVLRGARPEGAAVG